MITSFNQIEEFFKELNNSMHRKVNVYVIGGAALLRRGLKIATKDIDLVVVTKHELLEIQDALKNIGFKSLIPGRGYSHMNLSQIFIRGDFRIDLFEKEVCGRFSLSKGIIKRGEKVIDFNNIAVHLCSNEDILLFKTMTERDGDIADCISIASTQNPDWNVILEELKGQIKQSKQDVWITWIGERFDILAERGVDIPIIEEFDDLREQFFEYLEKKHSEK